MTVHPGSYRTCDLGYHHVVQTRPAPRCEYPGCREYRTSYLKLCPGHNTRKGRRALAEVRANAPLDELMSAPGPAPASPVDRMRRSKTGLMLAGFGALAFLCTTGRALMEVLT